MSLFTFKEVCSIDCNEKFSCFSSKSLVVGNVDNEVDGDVKFILGSFTGILRIIAYSKTSAKDDASHPANSPNHHSNQAVILAELNLGLPILQVEADVFLSGSEKMSLAVLHPYKLSVFSLTKLSGQVEHGSQYKITLLYEHQLKRHGFSLCYGPFGHGSENNENNGVIQKKGRQFFCVQSLDGTLSFFEQELFTFCRYLPGVLVPGQLAYVPSWDAFLTVISWNLLCFKYTNVAMAKDDPYQQQFQDTTVGKKLSPDWTSSVGEECVGDIQVLSTEDPNTTKVIICTFRNIICYGEGGILIWSKRLDYQVSSFLSYFISSGNLDAECITITGSNNEPYSCYVYSGTSLRWAAKLSFSPVCFLKANFKDVSGGLVALSCDGKLVLGCLGTVPSLFVAPPVLSRDLDYESAEKELNELRKTIASTGEQSVLASKDSTVEIKLEFEGQNSKWIESTGAEVMCLIGALKIICHLKVNDVRVTISTPRPIICNPETVFIGDIIGRHNLQVEFFVESEAIPSDLQCDVYLFYVNDNGAPHFVKKCGIKIPLFVVAKPCLQLEKDADIKLTFSINKPTINLTTLYNDFEWNSEGNPTGISFILYNNEKISLLSSNKTASSPSSKYRIQSSTAAAIYLVFKDFRDRLNRKYGREKPELVIELLGFENDIPFLGDYFTEIDAHILRRRRDVQIKEDLSDRAAQLRAIQRRLLVRFRDKNPASLVELEVLFDGSLDQVGDCLNFIEENELEKQKIECRLSGATKLLLDLISLKKGSQNQEQHLGQLSHALTPNVWDFAEEHGWEESVYTGLTYLKSQVVIHQTFANLDQSKLKKAIKSALEKARKDPVKISTPASSKTAKEVSPVQGELLVGNEIIERMTSARGRKTKKRNPTLEPIPEPTDEESHFRAGNNNHREIRSHGEHMVDQEDLKTGRLNLDSTEFEDHGDKEYRIKLKDPELKDATLNKKPLNELNDEGFW